MPPNLVDFLGVYLIIFFCFQFISHVIWQVKDEVVKLKNLDTPSALKRRHTASALFKDVIRQADKRESTIEMC